MGRLRCDAGLEHAHAVALTETRRPHQACDDKVCFSPQSVPLAWTLTVRPLDRERAKP